MNKTTIFSIIGIAAVVVIGIFVFKNNPDSMGTDMPNETDQVTTGDSSAAGGTMLAGKKMPFSEFVKQGGSYQCTVNQYLDAGMTQSTTGTVYVADGNLRGEYTTKVQGIEVNTSVIVKDKFAYTWTSMAPVGYKAPIVETVGGDASVGTAGQYSWNDQMIGDYDCTAWTTDMTKFTLPTNITFQEVKQQL